MDNITPIWRVAHNFLALGGNADVSSPSSMNTNVVTVSQDQESLTRYGGQPLAYSTGQQGVSRFRMDSGGYLAYTTTAGVITGKDYRLVLGDPIADRTEWGKLLNDFLNDGTDTTFFQIGNELASSLQERGFTIARFGYESSLRLPFSLKGKYRRDVRRMVNRAQAEGVVVLELTASDRRRQGISDRDVKSMVRRWLATRIVHDGEFRFLARPLQLEDEFAVRKFYALHRGELCGIAVYDPLFREGRVVGYTESIARVSPRAPKGTRDLLLCTALSRFSEEGYELCSLGLSPLAPVPPNAVVAANAPRISRLADALLRVIYHALNEVAFNFKGTQFKKRRYVRPELGDAVEIRPVYLASPRRLSLVDAYNLALAMGVSPWRQILRLPACAARSGMRAVPALLGTLLH